MADFNLTQTDQQVQNILNDGQSARGAGAQTTLTTEYVMLKDTNGVYHKILKDSLTEACRNVLAGLLVNNDKGTTISQIPAIASGDFGSVTPANLASVLGETPYTTFSVPSNSSRDILTFTASGVRWVSIFISETSALGFTSFYIIHKNGTPVLISTTSSSGNEHLIVTSANGKITLANTYSSTVAGNIYLVAGRI